MRKLLYFLPGAAIGFIVSSGIGEFSGEMEQIVKVFGLALLGGSLTTALGNLLFHKAEYEAQKSGGIIKVFIRFLVFAIIIVAGILILTKAKVI